MKRTFVAGLAIALVLTTAACSSGHAKADEARMPASSSDLASENYKDALGDLEDAGFTNVSARPLGDLIIGLLHHPGDVADVVVAGSKDSFDKGAVFKKKIKIVIEYHSNPAEPQPSAPTSTSTSAPSAGSSPTDAEVIAAFNSFFAERKAAGVMVGKAVTNVTYANRVVTVTFDPAAAGVTPDTFDRLNSFPNLAEFAATPIAFDDEIGNRIRPVVDSLVTVRSDGKPLGTCSHAEILALNGLSQ